MAELSVHGVVLRRRNAGESDRRLTLLTKELGKIDVTAKGARKAASRLSGVSEPLNAGIYGLATGKKSYYVTQAQPISAFRALRTDYDRLTTAFALLELYAAVLPYEEPSEEAFHDLSNALHWLETHERPLVAYVWCQTTLLSLAGFRLHLSGCVTCGNVSAAGEGVLSPSAGGLLCAEHGKSAEDSFLVKREILIGLQRTSELSSPPSNLKFNLECYSALMPFWRRFAESSLPANESLLKHLKSERLQPYGSNHESQL